MFLIKKKSFISEKIHLNKLKKGERKTRMYEHFLRNIARRKDSQLKGMLDIY